MDDPNLKNQGLALVRNYGCAGCHEIAGLEEEQRIGTELTKEGSKPIERLDFALLGHKAEAEEWYTHKGFFEHKLENRRLRYRQGEGQAGPAEMPNFNFSKPEIDAVTTFLEGSVECQRAVALLLWSNRCAPGHHRGWWVIRKYNCMGCHKVHVGQNSIIDGMAKYQDPDWKDQRSPTLIGRRRAGQSGVADAVLNTRRSVSRTRIGRRRQYLSSPDPDTSPCRR